MQEEDIISFDNLFYTAIKCSKGVKWKPSVANYMLNLLEETNKLYTELIEDTYKERPHREFKIFEPKERDILSISFRDRVYQRTLTDFIVYPKMTKGFIQTNCASQKDKGNDYARECLKYQMRSYYQSHKSNKGYIIHIDIKKYYPTMNHELALNLFKEKLPKWAYKRVENILKVYKGDIGYSAGSQLVQILGIVMLDSLDHYIKEKMRVHYYIRYMDDLVLLVENNPQKYISEIEEQLKTLCFEIHKDRVIYNTLSKGDTFLGFNYSLGDKGKVYMCLSKKNIKRRKKKIRTQGKHSTLKEFEESYQTWRSYASKSTNKKFLFDMDKYYSKYKEVYYDIKN